MLQVQDPRALPENLPWRRCPQALQGRQMNAVAIGEVLKGVRMGRGRELSRQGEHDGRMLCP